MSLVCQNLPLAGLRNHTRPGSHASIASRTAHPHPKDEGRGDSMGGGARSTVTPQHPRPLVLAASSANKNTLMFGPLLGDATNQEGKTPHRFLSTPEARAETRGQTHVLSALLAPASAPLLAFTAKEQRREKNSVQEYCFFPPSTPEESHLFILRKGPQKSGSWGKRQGCCQQCLWTRGHLSASSDLLYPRLLCGGASLGPELPVGTQAGTESNLSAFNLAVSSEEAVALASPWA